jgi:hypothetical protein
LSTGASRTRKPGRQARSVLKLLASQLFFFAGTKASNNALIKT